MLIYLVFIASLTLLLFASDWFISAAEKIGLSFGISPFIIGVTIVAFGTSLPELAASLFAVYSGASEIVIGNVVGSNITNILLIIGVTSLVGKGIKLDFDLMSSDMPLLIISSIFLYFAISDLEFSIYEAIFFFLSLILFLINTMTGQEPTDEDRPKVDIKTIGLLIVGGAGVYFGAEYTIDSIKQISGQLGLSPDVIALTAVALGTSLPEVIVSLNAAKRGNHAIAVGNVLGSNIFNTYGVMAIPAFFGELTIPASTLDFSIPFMVAVTLIFLLVSFSKRISKWEGMMMIILYFFFISCIL